MFDLRIGGSVIRRIVTVVSSLLNALLDSNSVQMEDSNGVTLLDSNG